VAEIYDYDRIGADDPMGRVEVDLAAAGIDGLTDGWHALGWIPGQTRPGPRGELKLRIRPGPPGAVKRP
jgi:hypothetical protein